MRTPYGAWRASYTQGRWVVLSGPTAMIIMEPAPASASGLINAVWDELLASASIAEISAALAGFGLDQMPNLAVLLWDGDSLVCLLRGKVKIVDADSMAELASGVGARTWYEADLEVPRVEVLLDDVTPADLLRLPLVVGAVEASAIFIDIADSLAVGAATTPELVDAVPESEDAFPESEDAIPELVEGSPESDLDVASTGSADVEGTPESADVLVPESEDVVPELVEGSSESVVDVASTGSADVLVPESEDAVPELVEGSSESVVDVASTGSADVESPESEDVVPELVEGSSESVVDVASTGSADVLVPESEGAIPEVVEGSSEFVADVASTGSADVEGTPESADLLVPESEDAFPELVEGSSESVVDVASTGSADVLVPELVEGSESSPDAPVDFEQPQFAQPQFGGAPPPPFGAADQVPAPELAVSPPRGGFAMPPAAPPVVTPPVVTPPVAAPPVVTPPVTAPPVGIPPAPPSGVPVGFESTEVLGQRPDYAPGQEPGATGLAAQTFGQGSSGNAGPWGAQGFAAAADLPPEPAPAPGVPAPMPPQAPIAAPVRKVDSSSDHDGETVFTTGIAATHKPSAGRNTDESLVLAAVCALGHANEPGSTACRICGGPVDSHNPQLVNRPVLAIVATSAGEQLPLTGPILIGRAPSNTGNDLDAELMRVPSPNHDISRTHVRIAPHEWSIEVSDLYSTNGTIVVPPGGRLIRLEPGQSVELAVGGQIDLGDGQVIELLPPQ